MASTRMVRKRIPQDVSVEEVEHFERLPLARPTLEDPDFEIMAVSRNLTFDGRGHSLMAGTWNTHETIRHLLSLYRPASETNRGEIRRFYSFGTGLNAHPDLLHGGVMACILDSTMSNASGLALNAADTKSTVVTAQLNIRYHKPVRTPGTVMARAWATKIEDGGRKVWTEAIVEGGDNGEIVHARADGLWIRIGIAKL